MGIAVHVVDDLRICVSGTAIAMTFAEVNKDTRGAMVGRSDVPRHKMGRL